MEPTRKPSRRSFMAQVLGGVAGGGALVLVSGRAAAQTYTGVTDSDTGNVRDRPGYGVGTRSQYTDQDTGPNRDAQFHGRGPAARGEGGVSGTGSYGGAASGCSDADTGPARIPAGAASAATARPSPGAIRPATRAIAPIPTPAPAPTRSSRAAAAEQAGILRPIGLPVLFG